jgi:subtilisin family serine protease
VNIGGHSMRTIKNIALAGLLALGITGTSFAADEYIVRTKSGSIGILANRFGVEVKDISNGNGVFLVRGARLGVVQALRAHPDVVSVQANTAVALPEVVNAAAVKYPLVADPKNPGKVGTPLARIAGTPHVNVNGMSGTALPSKYLYMAQPGIVKVKVPADLLTGLPVKYGNGVRVAVIDTWVDASVTTLAGSIDNNKKTGAYDCINNRPGGTGLNQETSPFIDQETSPFIDQETSPFIDSTGTVVLNQETSPFIDQETSPFIDQETSPFIDGAAYGHGTMVAGLVHRIAPGATLVPIRAFHNTGSGSMADVIQGIYYATDTAKVNVITMSFSSPSQSDDLKTAIAYAQSKGVICVASVSNSSSGTLVYPAAEDGVIGIAATDYVDFKASFSDWGNDVALAAPGVDITSTYPRSADHRDHWAMASGTSFSTPIVAGTVALLKTLNWSGVNPDGAVNFLDKAADPILDPAYRKKLGAGRLDVSGSASAAKGN